MHGGIKKDEELENHCVPRADLWCHAEQYTIVCVVFFLIVKSCKQKSPPGRKYACQANFSS